MERIHKCIIGGMVLVLALLVGITVYVALTREPAPAGFVPPQFDENAVSGVPEQVPEELQYVPLELKDGFHVSLCASPIVDRNGQVTVYFTTDSNNDVYVRMLVLTEDGEEIGTTGLLRPGEYVQSVSLDHTPNSGETIIFKFLSYEPDTYYSMGTASAKVVIREDNK